MSRQWVLPTSQELPSFNGNDQRTDLLSFWERIAARERHEDNLLNARLQGFVLGTSLLLAGLSQFRDPGFRLVASLICIAGAAFSLLMLRALHRTARATEWYLAVLASLDRVLFPENQQPYWTRRRLTNQPRRYPMTALLSVWIPGSAVMLWIVLLHLFAWGLG